MKRGRLNMKRHAQMSLFTYISANEWNNDFIAQGIQAGQITGTSDASPLEGKNAILTVDNPNEPGFASPEVTFPFYIVKFIKHLIEVRADYDDDTPALGELVEGWVDLPREEFPETYEQFTPEQLQELGMYGSFVLSITPEEIQEVLYVEGNPETGKQTKVQRIYPTSELVFESPEYASKKRKKKKTIEEQYPWPGGEYTQNPQQWTNTVNQINASKGRLSGSSTEEYAQFKEAWLDMGVDIDKMAWLTESEWINRRATFGE
ncbi:hypothetical protein LCGC14_2725410 [marine sediment metagenome]|uniref:Uncharacterized protein n=1 Tax=marine sediment metagenome TaxID=412755 RepID=A0A0F9C0J0_9ZZZZ